MLDQLVGNIQLGLGVALTSTNLFYCFLGVTIGMAVGVIPGIGVLVALSLLVPVTFYLEPVTGLMMLAGIYYGVAYGGSTAAILLNVPGAPTSMVTAIDGYPMAKQGRGGIALLMTALASFFGGSIGILLMMFFAPMIARSAIHFGSSEYFLLMVLGLIAASSITRASISKGVAMVLFGIALGTVGLDLNSGVPRYTFGIWPLYEGISLVAIAMGMFGIPEVVESIRVLGRSRVESSKITFRSMIPKRDDWRRSWMPALRGAGIGSFFGTLPGTGGLIASFMAYAVEKRVSSRPQEFGEGAIEGIVAPEAANNAADQTAFIPTLTLGIPGSAAVAIIMGVMVIHGITPGPQIVSENPELFWGLIMSFWIGNLILLVLNIPLIGVWLKLMAVPYHLLYPAIVLFLCVGVYAVHTSAFDVWILIIFGVLGYAFRLFRFPAPPLILGFILGPLMEEHMRRALLISKGDFSTFLTGPINITIIAVIVLILFLSIRGVFAGKGGIVRNKETVSEQ